MLIRAAASFAADLERDGGMVIPDRQREALSKLTALPYLQGYKPAPKKSGVTLYDREAAYKGLNFYVCGHAPRAYLMDMNGKIVHEWGTDLKKSCPSGQIHWRRAHLFENGDVLAFEGDGKGEGMVLLKLDKHSNLLWSYDGRCHHDLFVEEDGNIYVLTKRRCTEHSKLKLEGPIWEDCVTILSPKGEEIKTISLLDCFLNSEYAYVLYYMARKGDPFHTNTIELFNGSLVDRVPMFKEGHALISIRHLSTVAIVDLKAEKVTWMLWGMWRVQHQPVVLENGNILLFDNGDISGKSRVMEFNPLTQEIVWAYRGDATNKFFSETCGSNQRLPNGNTLISESESGRAFEVTPDNKIVWEFINPHRTGSDNKLIATLFELIRIEPGCLSFLSGADE